MGATPAELDAIIDAHFMFEATDDIDGVVGSLADEVEHEVIPSPMGISTDKGRIHSFYQLLFAGLDGESATTLHRYYGADFVIDETLWQGQVRDGHVFLCDGKPGPVSFRLLHVFEVKDGNIAREQVWCDLAAIQQQLGCAPRADAPGTEAPAVASAADRTSVGA